MNGRLLNAFEWMAKFWMLSNEWSTFECFWMNGWLLNAFEWMANFWSHSMNNILFNQIFYFFNGCNVPTFSMLTLFSWPRNNFLWTLLHWQLKKSSHMNNRLLQTWIIDMHACHACDHLTLCSEVLKKLQTHPCKTCAPIMNAPISPHVKHFCYLLFRSIFFLFSFRKLNIFIHQ